jgi:O-antigen/teichoic acid export membrane protein
MNSFIKYKKIFSDFGINILASLILTMVLQIVLYPFLAENYNSHEYGVILVVMGIYNSIVAMFGTALNNTRLILNEKYVEKGIEGDFNLLLLIFCLISFFISYFILSIVFSFTFLSKIFLVISIILGIIRSYSSVAFRINLKFKLTFYCNCIIAIGYVVGILLVKLTNFWPLAFCVGEFFACLFIWNKTTILKEKITTTKMFKYTSNRTTILLLTILMENILIYLDRLLLMPFLGASKVAIFTVASFFGKGLGTLMIPISGVLLSYYSKKSFRMSNKVFWKINIIIVIVGCLFYILSYVISPWVTGLLYPSLVNLALPYIFLANLGAIINIVANIVHPSVLKYAPIRWQFVIQMIYGLTYVGLGVLMINIDGLRGFCIAVIIANLLRLVILLAVGTQSIKRETTNETH